MGGRGEEKYTKDKEKKGKINSRPTNKINQGKA
jgi:hypothetical protein